jgi:predicted kinase
MAEAPLPPSIVAVLGIDGSGKSTLSRRLAVDFSDTGRTALIGDRAELFDRGPVECPEPLVADRLREWMSDMAHRATSLDDYKLPKIAELVTRDRLVGEIVDTFGPRQLFMDGMPLLNLAAWTILYRAEHLDEASCSRILAVLANREGRPARDDPVFEQFPELTRMVALGVDNLRAADAAIFLDVPPGVCMERIEARGKDKQVHETVESLGKLREAYLLVCRVLEKEWKTPVLVLDGDRDADAVAAEAREFVESAGGSADGD